ncbi:hypothetical protein CDAR_316741 [Caerostris darwini]|uniref:Transcription factor CBF/NF-Y/archaeal histone domain-containing protein n=1 Tax=Caerostris darwini TaxID=1538125 RepID=A0AAV4MIB8_9ARAC|nr:hypothetical protein CDAR_316741 [Caerostris darwini]
MNSDMNPHQPSTPIPSRRLIKIESLSSSLSTKALQVQSVSDSLTNPINNQSFLASYLTNSTNAHSSTVIKSEKGRPSVFLSAATYNSSPLRHSNVGGLSSFPSTKLLSLKPSTQSTPRKQIKIENETPSTSNSSKRVKHEAFPSNDSTKRIKYEISSMKPSSPRLMKVTATPSIKELITEFVSQTNFGAESALNSVASSTMKSAGIGTDDPKMNAFLSLASCKFVHDIVRDAMKYSKMEDSSETKKAEEKKCLKMEHLAPCLAEYGIRIVPQMEIKKNKSN